MNWFLMLCAAALLWLSLLTAMAGAHEQKDKGVALFLMMAGGAGAHLALLLAARGI
jgi:hypothetical protein